MSWSVFIPCTEGSLCKSINWVYASWTVIFPRLGMDLPGHFRVVRYSVIFHLCFKLFLIAGLALSLASFLATGIGFSFILAWPWLWPWSGKPVFFPSPGYMTSEQWMLKGFIDSSVRMPWFWRTMRPQGKLSHFTCSCHYHCVWFSGPGSQLNIQTALILSCLELQIMPQGKCCFGWVPKCPYFCTFRCIGICLLLHSVCFQIFSFFDYEHFISNS